MPTHSGGCRPKAPLYISVLFLDTHTHTHIPFVLDSKNYFIMNILVLILWMFIIIAMYLT